MALFNLPERNKDEKKLIDKVKSSQPAQVQLKLGKNSLLQSITNIKTVVETNLGKYRDRYELLINEEEISKYIDKCLENGIVSLDTETTGLDCLSDTIVSVQLFTPNEKAIYIPINHISYIDQNKSNNQADEKVVAQQLERLKDCKIIYHNAKFDWKMIKTNYGIDLPIFYDTMLVSKLLNPSESANLKYQWATYVDGSSEYNKFSELFEGVPIQFVPINTAYLYGAKDAEMTFDLYQYQLKQLEDKQRLKWVAENIEFPCIKATGQMELNGVLLDFNYVEKLKEKYNKLLEDAKNNCLNELNKYKVEIESYKRTHINHKLDDPINISSPSQLATFFYDILKTPVIDKKKPKGTGSEILEKINTPICAAILKYREIYKLISTYIDAIPEQAKKDGRIHCSFNQYGTETGRFSSSEPNLQNIPSHNTDIRQMFTSEEGNILISSDFSQQEVRIMAALSEDENMIQAYKDGKDIYSWVASLIYKMPYEDCLEFYPEGTKVVIDGKEIICGYKNVTNKEGKKRRSHTKAIVLGINYSKGAKSIGEDLGISEEEAQMIYDTFFNAFPKVKEFIMNTQKKVKQQGFTETLFGRRRYLPDMQLPVYEFTRTKAKSSNFNPIDFDEDEGELDYSVSQNEQVEWAKRLKYSKGFEAKRKILAEAERQGIIIKENSLKIRDAERQCVNSVIQGTAGDQTKLSLIAIYNNKELKDLGYKLAITVHDEIIGECPLVNAKRCGEIVTNLMSHSLDNYMDMKFKCDPSFMKCWYGEEIEI